MDYMCVQLIPKRDCEPRDPRLRRDGEEHGELHVHRRDVLLHADACAAVAKRAEVRARDPGPTTIHIDRRRVVHLANWCHLYELMLNVFASEL